LGGIARRLQQVAGAVLATRKTDVERFSQELLESDRPPDDWHDLLTEVKCETNRLAAIALSSRNR
jgi:hypothetical protein